MMGLMMEKNNDDDGGDVVQAMIVVSVNWLYWQTALRNYH
jgi:hypothetical protein